MLPYPCQDATPKWILLDNLPEFHGFLFRKEHVQEDQYGKRPGIPSVPGLEIVLRLNYFVIVFQRMPGQDLFAVGCSQ